MDDAELIRHGAEAWNGQRKLLAVPATKLIDVDLSGKTLQDYCFRNVTFKNCNLSLAILQNCDFTGATFFDCNLTGATIARCNLSETSFVCALLHRVRITDTDLSRIDLMGCEIRQGVFERADLRYSRIEDTGLAGTLFKDCKIYGSSVWFFRGKIDPESSLIITPDYESEIVTNDLGLAHYIYTMHKRGIVNMHNVRIFDPMLRSKQGECRYHVFISHASEDKQALARPLAAVLESLGLKVWFDEASLSVGNSLREKIDEGLSQSLAGVVVLSESFFAKPWARAELGAIFSLDLSRSRFLIPIWHGLNAADLLKRAPLLADRVAIHNDGDFDKMAVRILQEINQITTLRNSEDRSIG